MHGLGSPATETVLPVFVMRIRAAFWRDPGCADSFRIALFRSLITAFAEEDLAGSPRPEKRGAWSIPTARGF